ncbi:MAG TPA: ATP-grasp domain-containing protein, partial [Casimicrobiaceae bacterium]|nr:ATP-grasp domain-containing protein [Casimicrobiaceae bacterium]
MNDSVLMVSTASRWLGAARMPRSLAKAGFDVALLAPRGSLAAKSRFVAKVAFLPDNAVPMQWLVALIGMVGRISPRLVVPCDEMAVRLLFKLALEPPPGLPSDVQTRLSDLVSDSLGDPSHYMDSIDKTMLPSAAEAMGVRVPPYVVARGVDDAVSFANEQGYPVVLKRRYGFAGEGVAIVSTRRELEHEARRLLAPTQLDLGETRSPQFLVQAFVNGPHHAQAMVSRNGVPLAGFAWERHVSTQSPKGQTSVVRFVDSPETRAFTEVLCRGFGIGGFFCAQFIIDAGKGEAHLLEINRRIVTHMHMGERVESDLAMALHAHLAGAPLPARVDPSGALGPTVAVFPREWLRDPESRSLVDYPVDVPWDDPELLEALVAMRH